ncbi:MAG: hypothetical protein ACRYGO_22240 [Janthinobacterium lividum]
MHASTLARARHGLVCPFASGKLEEVMAGNRLADGRYAWRPEHEIHIDTADHGDTWAHLGRGVHVLACHVSKSFFFVAQSFAQSFDTLNNALKEMSRSN